MLKLIGHKKDVRAATFAPDGRVVSGGSDSTVRIWNPISGECLTTIKAGGVVYAVAVSPDGKTIAYGGRPARGATFNVAKACDFTGKLTNRYETRTHGTVWRWNPVTGFGTPETQPMARTIWSLSFSADGEYLAAAVRQPGAANISAGAGGYCWRVAGGENSNGLPGNDIYAVAFATAGHRLALTRASSVVFLVRPDANEGLTYSIKALWSPSVAFIPGMELAAIASNSFIEFVNAHRQEKPNRVKSGIRIITALAASPDGKTLLAGGKPGTVEVYDTATLTKRTTYDFGIGGVYALAYAPDGLTFAAAGDEGLIVCDTN